MMKLSTTKKLICPEKKGLCQVFDYGNGITVSAVKCFSDVKKFIKFPWEIYAGNEYWVPPLISARKWFINHHKNPLFCHGEGEFFIAQKKGKVVGTISILINDTINRIGKSRVGSFGFFETIDDYSVASALLATARDWARDRGIEYLRGPSNFTNNQEHGLLVEGFNSYPSIYMNYNPPYYIDFITEFGFSVADDLFAYELSTDMVSDQTQNAIGRLKTIAEVARDRYDVTIRKIRISRFNEEVDKVKELYNSSWSADLGYSPLDDREFDHLAKALRFVMIPELCHFAEIGGETAGFILAIPDINLQLRKLKGRIMPFGWLRILIAKSYVEKMRVVALGVTQKHREKGVDIALVHHTIESGLARGFRRAEVSWVSARDKSINNLMGLLEAKKTKTYRIYEIKL